MLFKKNNKFVRRLYKIFFVIYFVREGRGVCEKVFCCFCLYNLFYFCSCTADTSGESYELTSENWHGVLKGGAEVSLSFSDNTAKLTLKSGEDEITIDGLYVIDENSFIIFNQEFKQSYNFDYTVSGDKLTLGYCGNQIEIEKQVEN